MLGNQTGVPPPAWKAHNLPAAAKAQATRHQQPRNQQAGSKIFLGNLPKDVAQDEVEVRVATVHASDNTQRPCLGTVPQDDWAGQRRILGL